LTQIRATWLADVGSARSTNIAGTITGCAGSPDVGRAIAGCAGPTDVGWAVARRPGTADIRWAIAGLTWSADVGAAGSNTTTADPTGIRRQRARNITQTGPGAGQRVTWTITQELCSRAARQRAAESSGSISQSARYATTTKVATSNIGQAEKVLHIASRGTRASPWSISGNRSGTNTGPRTGARPIADVSTTGTVTDSGAWPTSNVSTSWSATKARARSIARSRQVSHRRPAGDSITSATTRPTNV
jgi:hypothetical protein